MTATSRLLLLCFSMTTLSGCFVAGALSAGTTDSISKVDNVETAKIVESDPVTKPGLKLFILGSGPGIASQWFSKSIVLNSTVTDEWSHHPPEGSPIPVFREGGPASNEIPGNYLLMNNNECLPSSMCFVQTFENNSTKQIVQIEPPSVRVSSRRWWGYPLAVLLLPPALVLDIINVPTMGRLWASICCDGKPRDWASNCTRCGM